MAKRAAKCEERMSCRSLIEESSEDKITKEARLHSLNHQFEERAYQWRNQADLASRVRKAADRSSHVAEELAEHAEGEREAAELRQIARQKAMASVENRGHLRESVEVQLAEAERAATEAATLAEESRKRADRLAKEAEKIQDHGQFIRAVAKRKWDLRITKEEYDAATVEKEEKERIAKEEKRRFDTNSLVYRSAARNAASEADRAKDEQIYQHEAIVAYNKTLLLRKQADSAVTKAEIAVSIAEAKLIAAKRAREYKEKRDKQIEIPVMLGKLTLLHTTRFRNWGKSLSLSNAYVHSIAQNVLLQMVDTNAESQRTNFHSFTKNHLCRVFAPWKSMMTKSFANVDPVLAWSLGCQLVSMTFHSADESLLVGDGRFRQNGSCGYALKPQYLTDNSSRLETTQSWSFCVLGGFSLPKLGRRIGKPCIRISLYEGSTEETLIMYKTKSSFSNGLNPVWDSKEVLSFTVKKPSIAIISFSVWDRIDEKSEVFVAGAGLPVSCLREGYRSISLFDAEHSKAGSYAYAPLLVKASKR
jgi:hypothetical protein